jgi:hypothetical protein
MESKTLMSKNKQMIKFLFDNALCIRPEMQKPLLVSIVL